MRGTFAFFLDLIEYSLDILVFPRVWLDQTLVHVYEALEQLDEV